MFSIPIEISAKHIHLSQKDLEGLFGRGYKLKKLKSLTQPGQFAAKETLDVQAGKRKLSKVRIVGPVRKQTQIELAFTDAFYLRIKPPIRESGNLKGSLGIVLIGPKGKIVVREGVIIPLRHIHCNKKEAESLNFKKGAAVSVKNKGKRAITFHNVKIRISDEYKLCMHLDTDEGNAAGIFKKGKGIINI